MSENNETENSTLIPGAEGDKSVKVYDMSARNFPKKCVVTGQTAFGTNAEHIHVRKGKENTRVMPMGCTDGRSFLVKTSSIDPVTIALINPPATPTPEPSGPAAVDIPQAPTPATETPAAPVPTPATETPAAG